MTTASSPGLAHIELAHGDIGHDGERIAEHRPSGPNSPGWRGTFHSLLTFSARETWLYLRGGAMIESEHPEIEPVPSMWKVVVFGIAQAERRERILSDWETNIFGMHLRANEKRPLH